MSNTQGYRFIGGPIDGVRMKLPKGTTEYTHRTSTDLVKTEHSYRPREVMLAGGEVTGIQIMVPKDWSDRQIIGHMMRCHQAKPTDYLEEPRAATVDIAAETGHGLTDRPAERAYAFPDRAVGLGLKDAVFDDRSLLDSTLGASLVDLLGDLGIELGGGRDQRGADGLMGMLLGGRVQRRRPPADGIHQTLAQLLGGEAVVGPRGETLIKLSIDKARELGLVPGAARG